MFYIIAAMLIILFVCFLAWLSAAKNLSWSDEEQATQDQEQIEYLAKWAELQHKRDHL